MRFKKIFFKKYHESVYLGFIIASVFIVFSGIFRGFFQQDEWFIFGSIISGDFSRESILRELFVPKITHFNPLTDLITLLEFKLFQLNYGYYAIISVFLHILTSILLFRLTKDLFKNSNLAFFSSATFALAAGTYQATSWVVVNHATQGAAIFGILTLILFLNFINSSNLQKGYQYFIFSLICLIVSLFFKETTIASFLLLPLTIKLFSKKYIKKQSLYVLLILILGIIYILIRVAPVYLSNTFSDGELIAGEHLRTQFINFILLPVSSLAQALIPVDLLILISKGLSNLLPTALVGMPNTTENDIFVYKRLLVILSAVVFLSTSIVTFLTLRLIKGEQFKRGIIFGYLFIILNSFIFLVSPERSGIMSVVDSRNLYYLAVGTSVIIAGIIGYLSSFKKIYGVVLFLVVLTINIYFLVEKINTVSEMGTIRYSILYDIKLKYSDLPEKAVFYIESDTAYYGLADTEKTLPFQSGFGQTLLVWYNQDEEFPQEMFKNRFLWGITDQGYKEEGTRGFGYFRDFNLLVETVKKYKLPKEAIIGFSWQHNGNSLEDISDKVIQDLEDEKVI